MTAQTKRRSVRWYGRDWRSDLRLRSCCLAARGLWADILNLMIDETDHFGCLVINGVSPGPRQIASIVGASEREIAKLMAELHAAGVFSYADDQLPDDVVPPPDLPPRTIISRRMIRDKAKEELDRLNGKGGGNPRLNPKPPDPITGGLTPPPTPGLTGGDKAPRARPVPLPVPDSKNPESGSNGAPRVAQPIGARPIGGTDWSDPENRKARHRQKVFAAIRGDMASDDATEIIEGVLAGNVSAAAVFERYSRRIRGAPRQ